VEKSVSKLLNIFSFTFEIVKSTSKSAATKNHLDLRRRDSSVRESREYLPGKAVGHSRRGLFPAKILETPPHTKNRLTTGDDGI
jgi:hypothetical protein